MERVIVTIQQSHDSQARDIEIPVETPVETLLREISLVLGWNDACELYAEPPGRVLAPSDTLRQAGVWDGARLTFQPLGTTSFPQRGLSPAVPPGQPLDQGPVIGWRPLDVSDASEVAGESITQPITLDQGPVTGWRLLDVSDPPTTPSKPLPQSTPSSGFIWQRLDED